MLVDDYIGKIWDRVKSLLSTKRFLTLNNFIRLVNKKEEVDLKEFGFKIEHVDKGGERRYNEIIATLQK